jgi:hypothetical protein
MKLLQGSTCEPSACPLKLNVVGVGPLQVLFAMSRSEVRHRSEHSNRLCGFGERSVVGACAWRPVSRGRDEEVDPDFSLSLDRPPMLDVRLEAPLSDSFAHRWG